MSKCKRCGDPVGPDEIRFCTDCLSDKGPHQKITPPPKRYQHYTPYRYRRRYRNWD